MVNFKSSNLGGILLADTNDLNNVITPGNYYAYGSNTISHKPAGVGAFAVEVYKSAGSYIGQRLTGANDIHLRTYNGSAWSDWDRVTLYADYIGEYTVSTVLSSNQSSGYSISTMIPLLGADALTITPVSLRLLDGSNQVTSGIEIDRKNKLGFSVSYFGTTFQNKGVYLVFRASK